MRTSIAAAMVAVVVCCAVLHPIHAIVVDPSRHESRVTPKPVDLAATGVPLEFIRRSDTPTGARSTTSAVPQAPVIYEISTRPWLYFLSQKYNRTIRLATIPTSEFEALAKQGVQVVRMGWLRVADSRARVLTERVWPSDLDDGRLAPGRVRLAL